MAPSRPVLTASSVEIVTSESEEPWQEFTEPEPGRVLVEMNPDDQGRRHHLGKNARMSLPVVRNNRVHARR